MIKNQLNEILAKEMSRKEFVQYIGSGLLVVFGISGLMKSLLQLQPGKKVVGTAGYGASAYGGSSKRA